MYNLKARYIVVGGGFGDEGKGKATQYLLSKMSKPICIRAGGGVNTGATIYIGDKKIGVHMLPIGAFMPNVHSFIGSGAYITLSTLAEEIVLSKNLLGDKLGYIDISENAHVVLPSYKEQDKKKEEEQKLGSTKNGVSVAASIKYSYSGIRLKDLIDEKSNPRLDILRQKNIPKDEINHIEELLDIIVASVHIIDPCEYFEDFVKHGEYEIIIEGTQGALLDVNHGMYPNVSAGSFTTYGLLDGVGYHLKPEEVVMTLKAYNTYFGQQNLPSAFDDNDFRLYAGEFGTTTGRPRKLAWLDMSLIKYASRLIGPTSIFLNRLDTLSWFIDNSKVWKAFLDKESDMSFDEKPLRNGNFIGNHANIFIDMIEEAAKAKVKYIGVGPKYNDVIERQ